MKSKIFSASLLWETMKKQIWLFALILLGFLLVYPLRTFQAFDQWKIFMQLSPKDIMVQLDDFICSGLGMYGLAILTAAALANGIFGFWWLHSRQKTDFYHSLPVKRETLFWTQTLVGSLLYLVPEILATLLVLIICASQGYFTMGIVAAAAVIVGLHFLIYLLVYGLTILAMVLTGTTFVGILGAVGFLTYLPAVTYLAEGYQEKFWVTYMGYDYLDRFLNLLPVRYGSPVTWCANLLWRMESGRRIAGAEILGGAVLCVLLFLLALWIYRKRPSESAGKPMVFSGFGKAVKFLVEVPGALLVGILAYQIAPSGSRLIWFAAGLVLGLLLIHGVMEIIYQMDFRTFFRHRLELGIEAVLVAGIVVFFAADLPGFDTYLPGKDELAYVSFATQSLTGQDQVILEKNEYGELEARYQYGLEEGRMQLAPDEEIYTLIEQIRTNAQKFSWKEDTEESDLEYFELLYHLDNGKNVYRRYSVRMNEELHDRMNALWNRQDFRDGIYSDWEDKKAYLVGIRLESAEDMQEVYTLDDAGKEEFLDAMREDIRDADERTYLEQPVGRLYFDYGDPDSYQMNVGSDSYLLYPGFSRVMRLLKEKDARVVTDLSAENIQKVMVIGYGGEYYGEEGGEAREMEYTEKEEFAPLLSHLVSSSYYSFQLPEQEPGYSVEVTRKNSQGEEIIEYYGFEKGYVPEMLKE